MLASDWLPILESHQDELLDEIGLYGYEFVQGGPFGNTLEYRCGAQWLVLEAVHHDGSKKAVRVPVHDRFAQEDHLERLRYVSAKLKEQDADWFPFFEIEEYDFGGDVDLSPCPVMVMDWIEGETYASAMWKNRTNPHELDYLDCQLSNLIQEMRDGGFDHGDVSVSNLRVRANGMMMLLDPDSLVHESMKLSESLELGHPTWNHPGRGVEHTKHLHIIPFELMKWFNRSLQINPDLLEQEPDLEEFYYTEDDLKNPYQSQRFHRLMSACNLNPHAFQDHDLIHLMDALEDDFDNIGQHIELPQKKTIEPRVTIEYLLNVQPIKKPHPRQERVKKPKPRLLKPTPFFQEFNRFNEE